MSRPQVPQPNGQDWYDRMQRNQSSSAYVPNPNPSYVPNPGRNPMPGQGGPPNPGAGPNQGQGGNPFTGYRQHDEVPPTDTDSSRRQNDSTPAPSESSQNPNESQDPQDPSQNPNDQNIPQSDPPVNWEAEFRQMKAENEILQAQNRDLRNTRNPLPRTKSLYELGQDAKGRIDSQYPAGSRLSMLPPQQQQVADLSSKTGDLQNHLNVLASLISLQEAQNENGRFDGVISNLRKDYVATCEKLEKMKKNIESAKDLSSRFKTAMPMPDFEPPAASVGYRFDPQWLELKNVIKHVGKFNPATSVDVNFAQFWAKIINYGAGKYLTEKEYLSMLKSAVYGEAITWIEDMERREMSLQAMVNEMADVFGKVDTIDDHRHAVDNFVRAKDETITRCMARARNLISRLAPLHSRAAWPEKSEDMGKAILKQVVAKNARIELELEESRMIRTGVCLDLEQMIRIAFDHEKVHKTVPQKETPTTYQVASMSTRVDQPKDDEINHLRRSASLTKNLDEKLTQMMETQNQKIDHLAVQVASASFKERGRSSDNFKQKGERRFNRSGSSTSRRNNDGDEKMQTDDKPVRADNRQGSKPNWEQGPKPPPSTTWPTSQPQKFQQPQTQGPRPPFQGQGPRPPFQGQGPRPPYQAQNKPWQQKEEGRFPQTRFRPKMIHRDGYHFYQCACTSWHIQNTPCPLSMSINQVLVAVADDEEEDDDYEVEEVELVTESKN